MPPNTPSKFFFARPVVRWPSRLPGPLIEQGRCRVVEHDAELVEHLLNQPSFPEGFATEIARDKALGFVNEYIEFVPSSWEEAQLAGIDVVGIAVGHSFGEPGFEEVAAVVLAALRARLPDFRDPADFLIDVPSLIIGRVTYQINALEDGTPCVGVVPLYASCDEDTVTITARWLIEQFVPERAMLSCD